MRPSLEIACGSIESALAAQAGGADRVELFQDLAGGGTTPSPGTLAVARDRLRLPLFVLIRPRTGDFVYSEAEVAVMLADIAHARAVGCDGVVLGALQADGCIDVSTCRALVAAAGPLQVTFHRAFDVVRDPSQALETVIALGCQRVLSSGGCATAVQGSSALAARVAQAAGRVSMMAGAGVSADTVAALVAATGCTEVHASASGPRASATPYGAPSLPGLQPDVVETDVRRVMALREALQALA